MYVHISVPQKVFFAAFFLKPYRAQLDTNSKIPSYCQQEHSRICNLKGKWMIKFPDPRLLWEWRNSWYGLAGPKTHFIYSDVLGTTPRSVPYFWPCKALKWDLKSHTENSCNHFPIRVLKFSCFSSVPTQTGDSSSTTEIPLPDQALQSGLFLQEQPPGSAQTPSLPLSLPSYHLL